MKALYLTKILLSIYLKINLCQSSRFSSFTGANMTALQLLVKMIGTMSSRSNWNCNKRRSTEINLKLSCKSKWVCKSLSRGITGVLTILHLVWISSITFGIWLYKTITTSLLEKNFTLDLLAIFEPKSHKLCPKQLLLNFLSPYQTIHFFSSV